MLVSFAHAAAHWLHRLSDPRLWRKAVDVPNVKAEIVGNLIRYN
jgi:hypothetical protein